MNEPKAEAATLERKRKRKCKHGVNKNTGACLKRPRRK